MGKREGKEREKGGMHTSHLKSELLGRLVKYNSFQTVLDWT
jgi:hypothetical protein